MGVLARNLVVKIRRRDEAGGKKLNRMNRLTTKGKSLFVIFVVKIVVKKVLLWVLL